MVYDPILAHNSSVEQSWMS